MIHGYPVIDAHAHIMPMRMIKPAPLAEWHRTYGEKTDEIRAILESPEKLLAHLDREGIDKVVCINYIARDLFGFTEEVHDYVIKLCRHAPDRLLPCGAVDPVYSNDVARDTEDLVRRGIKLLKVHGPHACYAPDDYLRDKPAMRGMYAIAEEAGVPVMFHTGTSIFPGARSKYGHPMAIDDIAIDFPKLRIIMAHGGRPLWMAEAFFLMRRHENVYMDISGIRRNCCSIISRASRRSPTRPCSAPTGLRRAFPACASTPKPSSSCRSRKRARRRFSTIQRTGCCLAGSSCWLYRTL